MESEADYDQLILPNSESSPSDLQPKLKRLKKNSAQDSVKPVSPSENPKIKPKYSESDEKLLVSVEDLERENESHGLDPLFWERDQSGAKRALDFDDFDKRFDGDDTDFEPENDGKKNKQSSDEIDDDKKRMKEKKINNKSLGSDGKPKTSKRKEKEGKKAHLAQLADFQRVLRERKCVGFKPVPMVEKPISSVLEKMRKRKMEMSKKLMASSNLQHNDSMMEIKVNDDTEETDYIFELTDRRPEKPVSTEAIVEPAAIDTVPSTSLVYPNNENEPHSSNERTSAQKPSVEETAQLFRAPVNDTQDLFTDSQTSNTQEDKSNEEYASPAEDVAPSLPSLHLKFDSVLPDDNSSDDEESDKENIDLHLFRIAKGNSSPKGDPVKEFVDEEALEDDSDDDLLNFQDEDEEDDADMEEVHDYIATDCKEKVVDREKRNELHQMWLQQQDEAGTENLLQKLKYGTKLTNLSLLEDEDDGRNEQEEDESGKEDSTGDLFPMSGERVSTKKIKQMIPQMFTDKDDGFVSSEDEETERKLYKERLLQKVMQEERLKFLSPAEDETSREVFGRIKKLNIVPETKKKPKSSLCLDSILTKGSSSCSSKSSFIRRASNHSMTSSHRKGSSTGRYFIFGRDDSNSRSSVSLPEESSDQNQESQGKKSASAKFICSQAKWSTQRTEIRSEIGSSTSLFEILKCTSVQADYDTRDNVIDHQAVFAAFKSVKKSIKIEGRY